MFISPAFAQTAGAGGSLFDMFLPLILVFAIIYFMILRPQQKRQKEHNNMIEALRRGDRVITQGGLVGKIAKVHETEIDLEIADGVKVTVVKSMVAVVQSKGEPAKTD